LKTFEENLKIKVENKNSLERSADLTKFSFYSDWAELVTGEAFGQFYPKLGWQ